MSEGPFKRDQKYDTSLKSLVQEHAAEILPCLCPGVVFEREIDIEIIRPTMRADRVYLVWYRNAWHILHIEFESSDADDELAARLHL
jgi:hypothetical protein